MEPVALQTPRVTLSIPVEADIEDIHRACQDADIQRYTTVPSPYLREHAEQFVRWSKGRWDAGINLDWAIRQDGAVIGMIGLYRIGGGSAEIGYWMARCHRGKGLLHEAAAAVIDWGFDREGVGAERIEWRAVVGNRGSARVAQRLGFRYEGTLRRALSNSFGRDDAWIAGLLRDDDRTIQSWPVFTD